MAYKPSSNGIPPENEMRDEYVRSIAKGRDLHTALLSLNQADRSDPGSLKKLYSVTSGRSKAPQDIEVELEVWKVDPLRFIYVDVESKGADDVAYRNRFNAKDGAILNIENIKERDKNPEGRRLWPSEAIWQSFLLAAKKEEVDPSNLRLIARHCIVNRSTQMVI